MSKLKLRNTCIISASILISGCAHHNNDTIVSAQSWRKATKDAHHKYAQDVESNLTPYFTKQNLHYPPKQIAMLAFKKEKLMELWAREDNTNWHHIKNYPLTAYSGELGPKLTRNDGQIPEGIYQITRFNPFSTQHLSMMLNYPNQFDKLHAKLDGRYDLGDNIFIHGKAKSVGCLAFGNKAIDELFVLVNEVGKDNTQIIIAPNDLRKRIAAPNKKHHPKWLPNLYSQITLQLQQFTET